MNRSSDRRTFLRKGLAWAAGIIALGLVHPLLRFLGFTVRPKPRYVTVPAPLPLSGYHAERDFLLFAKGSSVHAVSRTCTHLGCRVNYLEDRQIIECPCHQSRFSPAGKRLAGPAKRDLPVYPVEIKKNGDGTISGYVVTLQ